MRSEGEEWRRGERKREAEIDCNAAFLEWKANLLGDRLMRVECCPISWSPIRRGFATLILFASSDTIIRVRRSAARIVLLEFFCAGALCVTDMSS